MRKKTWLIAALILGALPALGIYAWQATPAFKEEAAVKAAVAFLKEGPTFGFDGVPGSIEVVGVAVAESHPLQYVVTVEFQCRHAGYGDRTGQMVAQVITPHEVRVVVSDGRVVEAVIDGVWDEVRQELLGS